MNSDGFAVSSKGITRPRRSILVAKEWNLLIWESICRCESTACINTRVSSVVCQFNVPSLTITNSYGPFAGKTDL